MTRILDDPLEWVPFLASGLLTSIELAALAMAFSIVLGLLLAVGIQYGGRWLRASAWTYVELARGIPGLATLYIVYFGLPSVGIVIPDAFWAAAIGLGMTGAGYMAVLYRAALQSVDRGQEEAGLSLGMSRLGVLRTITLPQALPVLLPSATNLTIDTLKDTSLASVIATPELMQHALTIVSATFKPMDVYTLAAAMYIIAGLPLAALSRMLERRARKGRIATYGARSRLQFSRTRSIDDVARLV